MGSFFAVLSLADKLHYWQEITRQAGKEKGQREREREKEKRTSASKNSSERRVSSRGQLPVPRNRAPGHLSLIIFVHVAVQRASAIGKAATRRAASREIESNGEPVRVGERAAAKWSSHYRLSRSPDESRRRAVVRKCRRPAETRTPRMFRGSTPAGPALSPTIGRVPAAHTWYASFPRRDRSGLASAIDNKLSGQLKWLIHGLPFLRRARKMARCHGIRPCTCSLAFSIGSLISLSPSLSERETHGADLRSNEDCPRA